MAGNWETLLKDFQLLFFDRKPEANRRAAMFQEEAIEGV